MTGQSCFRNHTTRRPQASNSRPDGKSVLTTRRGTLGWSDASDEENFAFLNGRNHTANVIDTKDVVQIRATGRECGGAVRETNDNKLQLGTVKGGKNQEFRN